MKFLIVEPSPLPILIPLGPKESKNIKRMSVVNEIFPKVDALTSTFGNCTKLNELIRLHYAVIQKLPKFTSNKPVIKFNTKYFIQFIFVVASHPIRG